MEDECLDELSTILESGWDVNEPLSGNFSYEPLLHAIIHSKNNLQMFKIVKLLLEQGANPSAAHRVNVARHGEAKWVQRTALHEAASRGWTDVVKMLLDAGAQCTISDGLQTPLALALQTHTCPADLIELLLKHGVDPNDHDDQLENIPLLSAITNVSYCENDTTTFRLLLTAGAKCKVPDGLPNPLSVALQSYKCPPDLIELLLEHGADANYHDDRSENIPLLRAIKNSWYRDKKGKVIVKLLLAHGANPNVTPLLDNDEVGGTKRVQRTALHEALELRQIEFVRILLEAGATCSTSDVYKNPLAVALQVNAGPPDLIRRRRQTQRHCCPPDIIKLLLKHGADPNDHDDRTDDSPLLGAIINDRHRRDVTNIVQLLLENGANPNVAHSVNVVARQVSETDKWVQRSALHEATRRGWTDVVKMLLEAGDQCTTSDGLQNPLMVALQERNCTPHLIELLLKHGADPNDHDHHLENIPLQKAIENWRKYAHPSKIVHLLLEYGANPNKAPSALQEAVSQGLTEAVNMLINAGSNTTSDILENPLALTLCKSECDPDLIELLLKHGADPNGQGGLSLFRAINNCRSNVHRSKVIQLLLDHGANPNKTHKIKIQKVFEKDKYVHRTALHEAASRGWTDVVKILIDAGAKYVTFNFSENPLSLALQNSECPPDLINLLLNHGGYVHYVDTANGLHEPRLLLHRLTEYTFSNHDLFLQEELDLLFLHGCNINMEDSEHSLTALECVVRYVGHTNCVRWLIRHGADTAMKFTSYCGHNRTRYFAKLLILLQAGMRISHGAQTQLSHMEVAISSCLQKNTVNDRSTGRTIQHIHEMLEKAEEEERQRAQGNLKKGNLPEYWTRQMVDLQEFSDESLQVYPEDAHTSYTDNIRQDYQNQLNQIHRVQEFLNHPQSLQLYCRRCIRENLVSLQPSVVKKLPGPASLKRYILCHEI